MNNGFVLLGLALDIIGAILIVSPILTISKGKVQEDSMLMI